MSSRVTRSRWALAAVMGGAGVLHFIITDQYARTIPRPLGNPRLWVQVSGVAELAAAGLLLHPRTRRFGGWFTAGLLVAVFPANVQMALDGGLPGETGPLGQPVVAWLRLPLQIPLVWWAVSIAREP